jgi:RNA polymerase sigma-70 factor (ECF subfamily)
MTAARSREDDRLVRLVRAADPAAFECLVERHAPALTGYARRLLRGSHHDAEEVVQDVFVNARKALLRNPARSITLRPWVYQIAQNACLDRLRKPLRTVRLEEVAGRLAGSFADPAECLVRSEALRLVVEELQRLPSRQRDALIKRELEGCSHEQVAAELGVSVAASKALVHRARVTMIARRAAA